MRHMPHMRRTCYIRHAYAAYAAHMPHMRSVPTHAFNATPFVPWRAHHMRRICGICNAYAAWCHAYAMICHVYAMACFKRAFGTVLHMRRRAAYAAPCRICGALPQMPLTKFQTSEMIRFMGNSHSPVTKQDKCDLVFNKCHKDYLQNVSTTGPLLPRL